MTSRLLPIGLLLIALPAHAQTFTFENGALDGEWFWTGNDPVFAPGHNSVWSISKESKDLCQPPLAKPWDMPFLFHPIPYDHEMLYSLTAEVRLQGLPGENNIVRVGLGWLDRSGGYGFYYDQAESTDGDWKDVSMEPQAFGLGFPNSEFGLVLALDPGATNVHGDFDNINVKATSPTAGIAEATQALLLGLSPNPVTDQLTLAMPTGLRVRSMTLLDDQGRTVRVFGAPTSDRVQLDLTDIPAGVYLLQVMHADGQLMQRVVKR